MNRFNNFIEKLKFKKIAIWYIILAIITGITCLLIIGYTYRDKISFAIKYNRVSEDIEEYDSVNIESMELNLADLSKSSTDIVDILVLDRSNKILYSTNNTKLAWDDTFNLKKGEYHEKFLVSETNPDIAFRYFKINNFIFSYVFAKNYGDIHDEYDEDSFYKNDYQNKKVYLLEFLGCDRSGNKVYMVNSASEVVNGMFVLRITAALATLLFMIYWLITALWIYQNARKSKLSAPIWGIIVLATNLAGVIVYILYKHINISCEYCGAIQRKDNLFCPNCGKQIGKSCSNCKSTVSKYDKYCPNCGNILQ